MVPCACGYCGTDPQLRQQHARRRALFATLNEHQARPLAASWALDAGADGPTALARVLGLSPRTVQRGIHELRHGVFPLGPDRARRPGGWTPCL